MERCMSFYFRRKIMLHRIKEHYRNPNETKLNFGLMNREFEKNIEEYVVDVFDSISDVIKEIKMTDWDFTIDTDKVNQSDYERTRSTRKADKEQKIAYINQSRLGELIMHFEVNDFFEEEPIHLHYTVKLLVPIIDEHGKGLIKGVNYTTQYQLTEISTYVTPSLVVLKSLMPVKLKREKIETRDTTEKLYTFHCFKIFMFTGFINVMYFYFATMGFINTLEYFSVGPYVDVIESDEEEYDTERYVYFRINSTMTIRVLKSALCSQYVESIVGTILNAINPRITYDLIFKNTTWVEKIGSSKKNSKKESHRELGYRYLILFNRMLDKATNDILRLTDNNKGDIYHVIRWMIQNYDALRAKDNLDIKNKRLRGNEYMASLLNGFISERIKKFVNTTANTKDKLVMKYNNFFSYKGNELISKIHRSGLMKYDDLVNDMDMFERLKITMKGPNAIGNKNSRNVSAKQRALDPSHIGIIGLDTCSASDPGLTNYINPLCQTNGLFFLDSPPEPEDFAVRLSEELGGTLEEDNSDGRRDELVVADPILFNNVMSVVDEMSISLINGVLDEGEETEDV